jgi:hypothetical protein
MYVCMYVCMGQQSLWTTGNGHIYRCQVSVCMYVCIYVCMYVCMHGAEIVMDNWEWAHM